MEREVLIPAGRDPWVCVINQKVYSYAAGSVQTVPDEVAELADAVRRMEAKAGRPGVIGQVMTRTEAGEEWADVPTEIPEGGSSGQYLKRTSAGWSWAALPDAGTNTKGIVKKGAAVENAASTSDVVEKLNALIASLVASGALAQYVAPTT